ncbi:hypothetical protein [Niabella ginsengisoli]|uniref:Uncharacterized protein n=1 Tax=Niabella ginsengisoli TaxID=522298 RepID=A0ABS9SLL0_9BACT|nr:hypothetical protein [Niabella ginsengisoli]MCH5599225.1 hypothetical protein [Niabella ginsengisoli]
MIALQIIIIILTVAYIIYVCHKQSTEHNRRQQDEKDLILAKQRLTDASDDLKHIEEELFPLVNEQFGLEYAEKIRNGIVTIGMPSTFLTMAWGHPQRIERHESRKEEHWFYKEQESNDVTQTQVVIQNQQVIKLKDF